MPIQFSILNSVNTVTDSYAYIILFFDVGEVKSEMSGGRNDRQGRSRQRELSPLLVMLGIHLFEQFDSIPDKPPVTIALLICNIVPHILDIDVLGYSLSNIRQNCINPSVIVDGIFGRHKSLALNRLILSAFIHADDYHLYYNMLSLSWKGINLERTLGSVVFLQMVVFILVCSHLLMVFVSYGLLFCGFDEYSSGYNICAVGFSAVLFGMKYVWNYLCPEVNNIMGLRVPSKYAAWVELVLISLITPNASFVGHLCGILAGMLYVHYVRKWLAQLSSASFTHNDADYASSDNTSPPNTRYTYARGTPSSGSSGDSRSSAPNQQQSASEFLRRKFGNSSQAPNRNGVNI